MHKLIKYRLIKFIIVSILIVIGVIVILVNLRENIIFFYTPTELQAKHQTNKIRIGGLVKAKSIRQERANNQLINMFTLTDEQAEIIVKFNGTLPLLFREGQGIVAQGYLQGDYFLAEKILAKHDERYVPKELADKISNK